MAPKLSDESLRKKLDKIIAKYEGKPDALIEVLHQAQEALGYLPKEAQVHVAQGLGVPVNRVYGIVTFYNLFAMVPKGRHTITVCLGTSCYVRGGKKIVDAVKNMLKVEEGGTTDDQRFSLEIVRCLGACALSPVITVDKDLYSHVTTTKIPHILSNYK